MIHLRILLLIARINQKSINFIVRVADSVYHGHRLTHHSPASESALLEGGTTNQNTDTFSYR